MTSANDLAPAALFDLSGRTAIVTGGSRGIGEAIARGYAAAGARVVVASRKAEACDAAAQAIRDMGGEALAVPAHVGRGEDIEQLVARTVEWAGGIDIVVSCAANPLGGPLLEVTEKAFTKAYEVNVLAPLRVCQAAMPHLEASEHASVVNVMTVGAFRGAAYLGLYTSSKAALWNLTRTMAKEWGPMGIRVNAIAPGPFETEMMAPTLSIPEFREQIVASTIQQRIADVSEIVGAALLLASDAGSYMSGSCVVVDGGTSA